MSYCAVHMMKMKASALGGIQSHNQREHESRKNKDINYELSKNNYDTVNQKAINYGKVVKDRIAELNLKKAVRKDAVVYCSFIVSSDREFFENLNREEQELFFETATEFFKNRYGAENVINGSVHLDETTPHMHLGVVPVTSDGRLSAKEIFTPLELKQLQTDFAEKVGKPFDLERGKEGSNAAHLDELAFKVKMQQERLEELSQSVDSLQTKKKLLSLSCESLEKRVESLNETVSGLKAEVTTLDTQKRFLEQIVAKLEAYKEKIIKAIEKIAEIAKSGGMSLKRIEEDMKKDDALEYIKSTGQEKQFEQYCGNPFRESLEQMQDNRDYMDLDER